jgi:hypothetical protein
LHKIGAVISFTQLRLLRNETRRGEGVRLSGPFIADGIDQTVEPIRAYKYGSVVAAVTNWGGYKQQVALPAWNDHLTAYRFVRPGGHMRAW